MKNKSNSYQYKIVEVSFDYGKLSNFSSDRGISSILQENSYSETVMDLKEKLLEELYEVIHGNHLTDHQKNILFMRLMGKTQNEIADHLGITQSAVHKAMHGNIDYKNQKKRYGGIVKKLKKICLCEPKIKTILDDISKANNTDIEEQVNMLADL
jgi:predicted XRE-type DNA-binding protein